MSDFRPQAPSAETVFLRTYSRRKADGTRENFKEAMLRTVNDIAEIGKFDQEEYALVKEQALAQHSFPSGRAFWVAGTEHLITVSPEALEARRIGDLGGWKLPLRILLIAGLPLAAGIVGLIVYVVRRR